MYIKTACWVSFLALAIFVCSCSKHRYLQVPKNVAQQDTLYLKSFEEYAVQPTDIIDIRFITEKAEYATLFGSKQEATSTVSDSYFYISGYHVDQEGNIEIPLVGKMHVAGLTVPEIQKLIHQKLSAIVYDIQVVAHLVSFKVSIIGEVKSPGQYTIFRDQANILQALSLAGDMNYYGNRKEVMIYRTTKDGTIPYSIDLTQRTALSSSVFYLQPNDMLYVQPLPRTLFRVTVSDFMTYMSVITTSLTLVIAIISLSK